MTVTTTGSTGVVFSALSALLDYLGLSTQRALSKAHMLLSVVRALPLDVRTGLDRFTDEYAQRDLTILQGCRVALFDRGRVILLYLFEYARGESRDCG